MKTDFSEAKADTCDDLAKTSTSACSAEQPTQPSYQRPMPPQPEFWQNGSEVHRAYKAQLVETIGAQSLPAVGKLVEFERSDGSSVLALVTSVDFEAQTCDLEYEGFVEGKLYRMRKRFVSFRQLGVTCDVRC